MEAICTRGPDFGMAKAGPAVILRRNRLYVKGNLRPGLSCQIQLIFLQGNSWNEQHIEHRAQACFESPFDCLLLRVVICCRCVVLPTLSVEPILDSLSQLHDVCQLNEACELEAQHAGA